MEDNAINEIARLENKELVLEVKQYRKKRSLSANAYFWVLCDKIAKVLGSTKEEIYLRQLKRYGVSQVLRVIPKAVDILERQFRTIEKIGEPDASGYQDVICYFGSSSYNTKEMSRLINGTVDDAKELEIDTWTADEIKNVLSVWRSEND